MKNNEQSVQEIKAAMDAWGEALYRKDLEAMHKDYASKYCLYDVKQTVHSAQGSKELWQGCFPYFDKPKAEYKDIVIHASDDMAMVHFKSQYYWNSESDARGNGKYMAARYGRLPKN